MNGPRPPEEPRRFKLQGYDFGLVYGTPLSGLAWGGVFNGWYDWVPSDNTLLVVLFVLMSVKAVSIAAVVFLEMFRPVRRAGIGIFTSVGLGILIFFGLCATNFRV